MILPIIDYSIKDWINMISLSFPFEKQVMLWTAHFAFEVWRHDCNYFLILRNLGVFHEFLLYAFQMCISNLTRTQTSSNNDVWKLTGWFTKLLANATIHFVLVLCNLILIRKHIKHIILNFIQINYFEFSLSKLE